MKNLNVERETSRYGPEVGAKVESKRFLHSPSLDVCEVPSYFGLVSNAPKEISPAIVVGTLYCIQRRAPFRVTNPQDNLERDRTSAE